MQGSPLPKYLAYSLNVDANHISITRGYNTSGLPTTELHFGVTRETSAYHVRYRASDEKSSMKDTSSGIVTVGPVVPWSLDFSHLAPTQTASVDETMDSNSLTTDDASKLLGQLTVDESSFYRISYAPGSGSLTGYHLITQNLSGDPNAHPMLELVIDPATFRVQAATFELSQHRFVFGGSLVLHVFFAQVGPYWLNTKGELDGAGHYAFVHWKGSYRYSATDITFPATLPFQTFAAARLK